jgi:hypothetical protein
MPEVIRASEKYDEILNEFVQSGEVSGTIPVEIVEGEKISVFTLRSRAKKLKLPVQVKSINKQIWLKRIE